MHPLRRVSLYYAGLFGIGTVLALTVPGVAELASQGPMAVPGFGGSADVFEPVSRPEVVRSQLEVAGHLVSILVAALLFMLPVSWVYMGTRTRTGFDQSVVQTMIILPIAVAGIVTIVHDSVALAFSLAGIVAGVRFRNSLKDTADALYIFAAIGVGLACGIGALLVAAMVSVFFNFVILLLWRCDYGVCPKGGPQLQYTSGKALGIDLDAPEFKDAALAKRKKSKKGGKKKKKKKGPKEPVDPLSPEVTGGHDRSVLAQP